MSQQQCVQKVSGFWRRQLGLFLKSLPIALSISRGLIGVLFLCGEIPSAWILVASAWAALSDALDGIIARCLKIQSPSGASADLLADGLFFLGVLVNFWLHGTLSSNWLAVILLMAVPEVLSQMIFWLKGSPIASPEKWWNRTLGIYSYCFVLMLAYGVNSPFLKLALVIFQALANILDLKTAVNRPSQQSAINLRASRERRVADNRRIKINYYFHKNPLFLCFVGAYWPRPPVKDRSSTLSSVRYIWSFTGRFPVLRATSILFVIVAGILLCCSFDGTLKISPEVTLYDVKDSDQLIREFRDSTNSLSLFIASSFPVDLSREVKATRFPQTSTALAQKVVQQMNNIIKERNLYDTNRFQHVRLTRGTALLMEHPSAKYSTERLNRTLLTEAYPQLLRAKATGLVEDLVMLTVIAVLIAGVIATRKLLSKVDDFIDQFPDMLKPESRAQQRRELIRQQLREIRNNIALRTVLSRRWWRFLLGLCLLLIVVLQLIFPFHGLVSPTWAVLPQRYPISFWVAFVWSLIWFLMVGGSLFWYVLATGFTVFPFVKRFADRNELWIVPNAPDGQGGLSPIGTVAFGMTSVLGTGMAIVAVWILAFGPDPAILLGGGIYSLAVTATLFLPLWSTHDAMRRAKRTELQRVANLFRAQYESLPTNVRRETCDSKSSGESELRNHLELMAKLEAIYATVKAMPVWPFDVQTLRKFGLLISTPLISTLAHWLWGPSLSKAVESMLRAFTP